MAKIAAPEPAPEPAIESFELDDELLELVKPSSGRKPVPSIYLDDVRLAAETGKNRGIKVPEDGKGTKIVAELHKAAKQLGVKIQTQNKEQTPQRFVSFRVKEVPVHDEHHEEHSEHHAE